MKHILIAGLIISKFAFANFSYSESVMIKNYYQNASTDIRLSAEAIIRDKKTYELNPVVAPFTKTLDQGTFQAGGLALIGLLSYRWVNINPADRWSEILLAQLVEAGANIHNKDPWQLEYGFDF